MAVILILSTLGSWLTCSCGSGAEEKDMVQVAMQGYMDRYPESQLRDVYKFCFQDYFGPEHLVSDSSTVAAYILSEIENADTGDWRQPPFAYPTGIEGNFVRVDLGYVREGIITVEDMTSAFMESSKGWAEQNNCSLEEWRHRWDTIQSALRRVTPQPKNFEEDSALIADGLAQGQYVAHHSRLFNSTYRQHYRIIRRDLFEKW